MLMMWTKQEKKDTAAHRFNVITLWEVKRHADISIFSFICSFLSSTHDHYLELCIHIVLVYLNVEQAAYLWYTSLSRFLISVTMSQLLQQPSQ